MRKRYFFASLFLIAALPAGCQTTSRQASVEELKDQFRNPPYEYRPIAGRNGADITGDVVGRLKKLYDVQGFGGYMFEPSTSKTSLSLEGGFSSGSGLKHAMGGLLDYTPAGQSPWVMTAPPGTIPSGIVPTEAGLRALFQAMRGLGEREETVAVPKSEPQNPGYLTREYFDQIRKILEYSKETGHKAVFYDEAGFPSGMANHTAPKELHRKILDKSEEMLTGPRLYQKMMPANGVLMAVVAMNTATQERVNLTPLVQNNSLVWHVPEGKWKIMVFSCRIAEATGRGTDYNGITDYLDPDAVSWFVNTVYEPHYKELGEYFGNTIIQTFWDDVGIYHQERTWTYKFNDKFRELTGMDPSTYYPALWENIGPETEAARVAFFTTRAELLAEGFPRVITEWCEKHNIQASGHAPGNYEIQPVDMSGDPFKYDRAQPVPMVDVIFGYPFGRDGFKLASDGGDFYDKPVTNAEIFAPFVPGGTRAGYRRTMELYIRGVNRFTGSGTGGGAEGLLGGLRKGEGSTIIGDSAMYAEWAGRCSLLLQGGRRVSEIAIFYPITALEAFYYFDAPEFTIEMRNGSFVPYETDYLAVGEMLLNQVHRDFTFIHPDFLLSDRIRVNGSSLELINKVNHQSYKLLIMPGERVISIKALEKIKEYYDAGGIVLATSLLPSKAAELPADADEAVENDRKVQFIVKEMFGIDSSKPMPEGISEINTNSRNGRTVFLSKPDPEVLAQAFDRLGLDADVTFSDNPRPTGGGGALSYVHKVKDGRDIYFFANSSDDEVNTYVRARGKFKPELWDPYTGETVNLKDVRYIRERGKIYTRFPLKLDPVRSVFIVTKNQ